MANLRKRIAGRLTDEQKQRHAQIRKQVEADKPALKKRAAQRKAELATIAQAMAALKAAREARGLSLADVARKSGIDKGNLSRLENDPHPNPTWATLNRIARAIGVRVTMSVQDAA